jgi:hypothetical protein
MARDRPDFNDTVPHSTDFSDPSDFCASEPDSGGTMHRPRRRTGGIARALLIVGFGVPAVVMLGFWFGR